MTDNKQADNPDTGRATSSRTEEGAERFKKATSAAADRAHEAIDHAEEGMHRGTDKVADAAERAAKAGKQGRGALEQAMDHATGWLDKTCSYVCEKPAQSVAMALVAGWLLGRLMRRR